MAELDPQLLFRLLAAHIPAELHRHMLVVGSLAAAYEFRDKITRHSVNTKDAGVVIQPAGAVDECVAIAKRLLADGWRKREDCFPLSTPTQDVRAIRLNPPESDAYFIELLALPDPNQMALKHWTEIQLDDGWYGLSSFRFMALLACDQRMSEEGVAYAAPSMMALPNLLHHPVVAPDLMKEPIEGRKIRRSVKDLARVLGLAWLSSLDEVERWPHQWAAGLTMCFPEEAHVLAARVGSGLRDLLEDVQALEDARHALEHSVLSGKEVTVENLSATGAQVLAFAIDPLPAELIGPPS